MQRGALKRLILSFWSLYFAVVWGTNLLDAARAAGLLPAEWAYASGNLALITGAVTKIGMPAGLASLLYAGVLLVQGAAAWRFWQASRPGAARESLYDAFGLAIGLWAAFLVADELFLLYQLEGVHLRLLSAQLLSLLVVTLVPDERT